MTFYVMVNVLTGEIYAYIVSREDLNGVVYRNKDGDFKVERY